MKWTWDPVKAEANRRKHGVSFELAQRVFDDPLALSRPDPEPEEERWQTVGLIEGVIVFVIHTAPDDEETGRIISARKATAHERKAYEEGEF
jgi:uncharacterized protein